MSLRSRSGACFDPTRHYRYTLWREWDAAGPRVTFIMLNPSTADATHNDPTIRRCIQLAQQWHFGALEVVNLFAYCATTPATLKQVADPIGVDNPGYMLDAIHSATLVVAAWGNWGYLHQQDQVVIQRVTASTPLYCLGVNQSGQPRHPLYLRRDIYPTLFRT